MQTGNSADAYIETVIGALLVGLATWGLVDILSLFIDVSLHTPK